MPDPRPVGAPGPKRAWSDAAAARYGLAAASVAVATLLTFALRGAVGADAIRVSFAFFYLAVFLSARYTRTGPALLALLLSSLAGNYFFLPPYDILSLDPSALIQTSVFVFVSLLVVQLTDRGRRAERAVRASRESLETTLRSIGDAVISTDAEGRVRFMNPVAERLTGWPLAEAAGRPLAEVFRVVNERTRAEVESPVEKVLREGRVVALANHTVLVARDGTEVPIDDSGAPITDGRGRTAGVVLVFHDVRERRRVEAERAFLAAIVESSSEAVIGKTLEGVVTSWNAAAERLYGYAAGEAVGRHVSFLVPPELRGDLAEIMARVRAGERAEREETVRLRKDGRPIDVSLVVSPVRDASGRLVGASSITRDITERKRAEERLRFVAEASRVLG